jgi:SAM-dependent methyltransferase
VAGAIIWSGRRLRERVDRSLRRWLRRHPNVRSGVYLAIELGKAATDTLGHNRSAALTAYERPDPWNYGTSWGKAHLDLNESLIELAASEGRIPRALDIGCGEGWFTERLLSRCRKIVAVDISPVALERARRRCGDAPHVHFERWDLFNGRDLGEFDLVLALGVLELFRRPRAVRRARRRIIESLAPGGQLLVTTTKQNPVVEHAGWSTVLVRGSLEVDRFLRRSGQLEVRAQAESDTHRMTLYRRAASIELGTNG